jgi:hypothetical protein
VISSGDEAPKAPPELKVERRRIRSRKKTGPSSQRLLVPLWEVDAVRALCGACIAPLGPTGFNSLADGKATVLAWRHQVPGAVLRALSAREDFGGILVFEVEIPESAEEADRRSAHFDLRLPISISRVCRVLCETEAAVHVLLARLRNFPDVPLGVVPIEADANVFGRDQELSSEELDLLKPTSPSQRGEAATQAIDKYLGTVAGILYGIQGGLWELATLREVTDFLRAAGDFPRSSSQLLKRLALACEPEGSVQIGAAFLEHLAARFAILRSNEGFEPAALLREIVTAIAPTLGTRDAAVLSRFESTASDVIEGASPAGRDLLADEGDLGLRATLLVLRVAGDIDQLQALSKSREMGARVRTLAWALLGSLRGCSALPVELKAKPHDRLLALGDTSEYLRDSREGLFSGRILRTQSGRRSWEVKLCDRSMFNLPLTDDEPLMQVLEAAESANWVYSEGPDFLNYRLSGFVPMELGFSIVAGPVWPVRPLVRASILSGKPTKNIPPSKKLQELVLRALERGLAFEMRPTERGWRAEYVLYLINDDKLAEGLLEAVRVLHGAWPQAAVRDGAIPSTSMPPKQED